MFDADLNAAKNIRCRVGRLVWNTVRMVKDPDTGKRLSRPDDEAGDL
jgi:hypothetical protein